jgi:acetyl-CoA C-acetyltransferase
VVVGVGQTLQRPKTAAESASPAALMADALRRAGEDTGTGNRLLARAGSVRVVDQMSWRYPNVAMAVAQELGIAPRQTVVTTVGGNSPQMLVNETCLDVMAGRLDVALLCGAEAIFSRRLSRNTGERLPWSTQDPDTRAPDQVIGIDKPGTSDAEQNRSLIMPTQVYPLFECALRAAAGETIEEHQVRVSELWARFSEVAAANPYAWSPVARSALEIRTVTPDNRMVGFPYPKLMNANLQTDQGAALILCSVEAARSAGVPEDRWVFPLAGADAHDHWFVSERWDLHSSPAIKACGAAVASLTGIGADDVAHIDLYSCFPSAVQMGAAALGLPLDDPARPLTVTGGLTFAGGPGNNYVSHSIATMVDRLRHDPGAVGLVTALGWYVTKHSLGLYSTTPPSKGFLHRNAQAAVDATPCRRHDSRYAGPITVEASTVIHERDGEPALGIIAGLTPDGARTWANTRQDALMKALTVEDFVGRAAVLREDGDLDLS